MSGETAIRSQRRFVVRWILRETEFPFLRVMRRFSPEKKKSVLVAEWEASPESATQFLTAAGALSEWERLGYARAEYVEVIEL